ncbi:MAG: hypothetical protein KF785_04920 [Gemmatimonadales bacterium]|nr:hypothetical protein [Gemmatimonadales bacterium]
MSEATSVPARFVFWTLYAAAGLVIVDQLAELTIGLYPFRAGEVHWRFGAFGLATGRATVLILVDALLLVAALGLGHRGFVRVWSVIHLVFGLLFLGGVAIFSLDVLEIRRTVRPEGMESFLLAASRAAVMVLISVVFCFWAGIAGWRSSSRAKQAERRSGPVLITGTDQ